MFDESTKLKVWSKAQVVEGYDPASIRKDACGAIVIWNHYGNRTSDFGWEIDHVYPEALGGGDEFANLRVMQWSNNVSKGDDYPSYIASVKAEGIKNINIQQGYIVNDELQQELKKIYHID